MSKVFYILSEKHLVIPLKPQLPMLAGKLGVTDGHILRPTEWLAYVVDLICCVIIYIMNEMQVGTFKALKDHMLSILE
jgi:hypothetical protein